MIFALLLVLLLFGGVGGTWNTPYRNGGIGLGGVVLVIVVVLAVLGRL